EIIKFAREENITQIMLFKHIRPRIVELFFKSLADELIRCSREIDIYVVTHDVNGLEPLNKNIDNKKIEEEGLKDRDSVSFYFKTSIGLMIAGAADLFLKKILNLEHFNSILIYILAVTVVSLFGKIIPSIMSTLTAASN
ncbi:MAG: hypothetical protein ACKOAD_00060, partial [Gammaproteobacteria bacterium]